MNQYSNWIKVLVVDINIEKIVADMGTVNTQRMVREKVEISILGIDVDVTETCPTEVTTIDQKKILSNRGKKQAHYTN